jgi:predicted amidohydrolase YtcJ
VVLDRDIEQTLPEELIETAVLQTYLEGTLVHDRF